MERLEPEQPIADEEPKKRRWVPLVLTLFAICWLAFLAIAFYGYQLNKPAYSDVPVSIEIMEGDTVPQITEKFEAANLVQSSQLLYLILVTQFDPTQIKASRYLLTEPLSTYQIAEKLITGDFATDLTAITIFEGESRRKIADRLTDDIAWFSPTTFMAVTTGMEGTLFPDTYFIPEEYTTGKFVALLHDTYHEVIEDYSDSIEAGQYTEDDIITLASIVEREANTPESMALVAGIYNNRLAIGMALQADASIEYVLDEGLHELAPGELAQNLRELDSPYNTYLYPGLPPTPIGNPGRDAIEAVLFPTESEYLYYITGNDGEFYYAETYDQHLTNINRYLR